MSGGSARHNAPGPRSISKLKDWRYDVDHNAGFSATANSRAVEQV
jgi:hypothetical protein